MLNENNIVELIKQIAVSAMEAAEPFDFFFGTVVSVGPLKINIEQKMVLGEKQLVLTRNVTNYTTTVSMDWYTYYSDYIGGTRNITINNALQKNEKVVLLKKKGGQKYLVLDRVVNL